MEHILQFGVNIDDDGYQEMFRMAIEALENCPPKESICYGCNVLMTIVLNPLDI